MGLNQLPTVDNDLDRGIHIPIHLCSLYNCYPESTNHLFMQCSTIWQLMANLRVKWSKLPDLNQGVDLEDLIKGGNLTWKKDEAIKYGIVIRAFPWAIWCNRNDIRFNRKVKGIFVLASEVVNSSFLWFRVRYKYCRNLPIDSWM